MYFLLFVVGVKLNKYNYGNIIFNLAFTMPMLKKMKALLFSLVRIWRMDIDASIESLQLMSSMLTSIIAEAEETIINAGDLFSVAKME